VVANLTLLQGAGTQGAASQQEIDPGGGPISMPLPTNGMALITYSVQPVAGNGGPGPVPAAVTVSSEWKVNDPTAANNYCYVAIQATGSTG